LIVHIPHDARQAETLPALYATLEFNTQSPALEGRPHDGVRTISQRDERAGVDQYA
jgi:hypothetical protein